jgi:hypothetical protein
MGQLAISGVGMAAGKQALVQRNMQILLSSAFSLGMVGYVTWAQGFDFHALIVAVTSVICVFLCHDSGSNLDGWCCFAACLFI